MEIKLQHVPIRDVVKGYTDDNENGARALNNLLNVRPAYQREFVYKDKQRDAVIDTIRKGFPLNVMYWVQNDKNDGGLEVLDGQQRTISICQFCTNRFPINDNGNNRYFFNLTQEEKDQILDYKIMVYICNGNDKEKLEWFRTINIAGEKLTEQELKNATYTGPWLSSAKSKFSKTNCPAYRIGGEYIKGVPIRQDYLETTLKWISNGNITEYMAKHQQDENANELWLYFNSIINWVKAIFPDYQKEMKGLDWGSLYNEYKDKSINVGEATSRIIELFQDEDVTKKSGIYQYILTKDEKYLNIRTFSDKQKREAYERQGRVCNISKEPMDIKDMEADHITPWSLGGKTTLDNCQMISKEANRRKSNK